MVYETGFIFNSEVGKVEKFRKFLDEEIGVEYEANSTQIFVVKKWLNATFFFIFGLNKEEVQKIREYEKSVGTFDYVSYADEPEDKDLENWFDQENK